MCLSDPSVNSQEMRRVFKKINSQKVAYTKNNQLSKFTQCMVDYMSWIVSRKVGQTVPYNDNNNFGFFLCCGCGNNSRNVRKQFQKAFESCDSLQQFVYYKKFIEYLTDKPIGSAGFLQPKLSLPVSVVQSFIIPEQQSYKFSIQLKGTFTWMKTYQMIMYPLKNCLVLKDLSMWTQTNLNLRNYILRESKHAKKNAYVLEAIVPISPHKVRFSIVQNKSNPLQIYKKIVQMSDRALRQNVLSWRQPIQTLKIDRLHKIQTKKAVVNLFQSNKIVLQDDKLDKKGNNAPQIKITTPNGGKKTVEFVDPLANKIMDKGKLKFIKKVKQFNDDVKSKKDNISNIGEQQQLALQIQDDDNNKYIGQQKYQNKDKQIVSPFQVTPLKQKKIENEKFLTQQQFKKKISLSEHQFIQSSNPINKRKTMQKKGPEIVNYAMAPSDTRSQNGFIKDRNFLKNKLKITSLQRLENNQIPDSSKDLVNQFDEQILIQQQQQQFGKVSELSNQDSFKTLPQINEEF